MRWRLIRKGGNGQALVKEIQKILADDAKNGVPADLVDAEKRHELASEEFQKNSISGLAMEWSNALAVEGRQSPGRRYPSDRESDGGGREPRGAQVSDARAMRSYALLTPQPSGKPVSSKSFGGAESLAGAPSGPVALPSWAQNAVTRLTIPDLTIHPTVTSLSNGIKLIVQPESISNSVRCWGTSRTTPIWKRLTGQEGVSSVLDQLFPYGTRKLDRIAFQKALDDIGADESAGADFSLSVLTPHFDRGMELLADNELHPALPENAFKVVQQQTADAVAGQLQSPEYLTSRALDAGLYPKNDPELREATPATVKSLTAAGREGLLPACFPARSRPRSW